MTYSIGEFSKLVGLSGHTLRYYEKEGLIHVDRNEHNIRVYSEENKLWIDLLLHLKKTGMSLKDMKEFVLLGDQENAEDKRLNMLIQHQQKVIADIEDLQQSLEHVNKKIRYFESKANVHQAAKLRNIK